VQARWHQHHPWQQLVCGNSAEPMRLLTQWLLLLCPYCSYTTTGSFSRSAINNSCGAKTPLAGFVTSMIVMCVLLFLTPIFKLMPYNTMGAIIIVGRFQELLNCGFLNVAVFCCG
jgi:hypothetical protein